MNGFVRFGLLIPVLLLVFVPMARSAETAVTVSAHVVAALDDNVVAAVAPEDASYPSDLGVDPIFWLDCADTNGWEFSADGGVTKACSRIGARKLVLDAVRPFSGWGNIKMLSPKLVEDPELKGGPALDFGAQGSRQGLVFDAWIPDGAAEGCLASNVLNGIATIVAVYGSQNGGGFLMGGGGNGIRWHRGNNALSAEDVLASWNPIFNSSFAPETFRAGAFWHDGVRSDPASIGFSGGWEVIAAQPFAVGDYPAFGLGINDTRSDKSTRSGGMKIAEMLIFDTVLTDEQVRRLDLYLNAKWLGRARPGRAGSAALSWLETPVKRVDVTVASGRTLSVGTVSGGRNELSNAPKADEAALLEKKGAGALAVGDVASYAGRLVVHEGVLAFAENRAVPTAEQLPTNLFARFDASDADRLETETQAGVSLVTRWRSPCARLFKGAELRLAALDAGHRPALTNDWIGGALRPVVDFGPYGASGAWLSLTTDDSASVGVGTICTVAYVIRPYAAAGHVWGGAFERAGTEWKKGLVKTGSVNYQNSYAGQTLKWSPVEGVVRVNGKARASGEGYDGLDYQVVVIQVPCCSGNLTDIGRLAASATSFGGFRLGEMLLWNRQLTAREIEDAEAYLSTRWLGKSPSGYVRVGATDVTPDLQDLYVPGNATIDVPAGAVARVGRLLAPGRVTKTGEGTLEIQTLPGEGESSISLKGGEVRYANPPDPGLSIAVVAANPSLHLDATQTGTFDLVDGEGAPLVRTWRSRAGGNAAYSDDQNTRRPSLVSVNGMNVVDFGELGANGKCLALSRSLNGVRSAFVVWRPRTTGCFLLGSNPSNGGSNTRYDFCRGSGGSLFKVWPSNYMVTKGEIRVNGSLATISTVPADALQLVEVHTLSGAHVSGLASDRSETASYGGQQVAEVILYERVLTEREKAATRNYLLQKWCGVTPDPTVFPPLDPVEGDPAYDDLQIDAGDEKTLAVGGTATVGRLTGTGTLTKSGAGTLDVRNAGAFGGTLRIDGGTVRLVGKTLDAAGGLVTDGRIFHADATEGLTTVTNGLGAISFVSWTSRHDSSWTAELGSSSAMPDVMPFGLAGKPVVDMKSGKGQYLRFKHGGDAYLEGIGSIFWVIGSQNGGGFLMGGGTNAHNGAKFPWHRGGGQAGIGADNHENALLNGSHSLAELRTDGAVWRLNGETVEPTTTGLSGAWDVLSLTVPEANRPLVNAQGFAFDGRSDQVARQGSQRLAEVIVYGRELSEAECVSNEAYLARKWGLANPPPTDVFALELSGGTLVFGGGTNYVTALSGNGTVTGGDVSPARLVADGASESWPVLDGTLVLPPALTVELRNLSSAVTGQPIPVLEASAVSGLREASVTFVGEAVPKGFHPRLRFRDGRLEAVLRPDGLMLIVR